MDLNILAVLIFQFLVSILLCSVSEPTQIRLSGGQGNHEGFVEVFHNDEWRPICDDHWDMRDGKVVCRQLGFAKALNVTVK